MVFQVSRHVHSSFFFFNDPATTEIYTLSLHDALPIYRSSVNPQARQASQGCSLLPCGRDSPRPSGRCGGKVPDTGRSRRDRKSTRLNSSHVSISYAVFCLKKKKKPRQKECWRVLQRRN